MDISKTNARCSFCAKEKQLDTLMDLHVHEAVLSDILSEISCFSIDSTIFSTELIIKLQYICNVCRIAISNAHSFFQNVCKSFTILVNVLSSNQIKDEESISVELKNERLSYENTEVKLKEENMDFLHLDTTEEFEVEMSFEPQRYTKKDFSNEEVSWSDYSWLCGLCNSEQATLGKLREHCVNSHNICFAAKCGDCLRGVLNFNAFLAHVTQHKEILKLCCIYCNYKSQNKEEAEWHTKIHKNTQPTCYKCGIPYNDGGISQFCVDAGKITWSHIEWLCSTCPMAFQTVDQFKKHCIKNHNTCFSVICMECETKLDTYSEYVEHLRSHLPILKRYCHICNADLGEIMNEDDHMFEVHLINTKRPCNKCGTVFLRNKVTPHYNKCNNLPTKPRKKLPRLTEDDLTCKICNKVLKSMMTFRQHAKTHNKNRQKIYCEQCGKEFFTDSSYSNHVKTVHGKRMFSCDMCHKQFFLSYQLKNHYVTHNQERPFICDICSKTFKTKKDIKVHIESVHVKEKKHQCKVCNKTFQKLRGLKMHSVQHTGEKPYGCSECSRVFSNYSNCYKHLKTRHGKTSVIKLLKK